MIARCLFVCSSVLPDQISKVHERSFEKFTKSSRMEIEDRTSSETVGNCRNVRKFPNKYKETFEKGISFLMAVYILNSVYIKAT